MIHVEELSKTIKGKTILSDISFEIKAGECVALIGPNGAGKSTLFKCLLGDLHATKGRIAISGLAPRAPQLKEKIAVLTQENRIPVNLKVSELLHFFKAIAPNPLSDQAIDQLLHFSNQEKELLAGKLSGGQKRLLSFVLCLISQPQVLFLDEPTAGMDTSTRRRFWEIVADLKAEGKTIVYSNHYIEEVEHTAERILVLHQGRLLEDTTPFAMSASQHEKQIRLPRRFLPIVEKLTAIDRLEIKSDSLTFTTSQLEDVWEQLQAFGCNISDIEIQNQTLLNSLFAQTQEDEK